MKLRKGDHIQVITGKDKGKQGKILRTLPADEKILVEGINIRKRHIKAKRQGEKGQRVEAPAPLGIAKVMLVCPHTGSLTRIGYRISGNQKVRISKKAGKEI